MWKRINKFLTDLSAHATLFLLLGGGAAITALSAWAAHATLLLRVFSPFSWIIAALLTALIFTVLCWIGIIVRNSVIRGDIESRAKHNSPNVNFLDSHFEKKRINISDFVPAFSSTIEGKTFVDCEISGPANLIMISDVSLFGGVFVMFDAAVVRPGARAMNVIALKDCTFRRCRMSRMTMYFTPDDALKFKDSLHGINWITNAPQ